jgi:protoporphyrinogen oxidase
MSYDTVVIGGGMAGMAAALTLAEHGQHVALLEANPHLGGLASSFERDGRLVPLGYHHILSSDAQLLSFLARFGLLSRVHWKRVEMGFSIDDTIVGLSNPRDFLRAPLSWRVKMGMAARVATAWWPLGEDEPASDWLRRLTGSKALDDFFNPLTQIKFGLPTSGLSAAWLRARLAAGEAGSRYGYMPNEDWVSVLVDALHRRLRERGVTVRTECRVAKLRTASSRTRLQSIELDSGERMAAHAFVAAIPTPILQTLAPEVACPALRAIEYTGVVSTVVATRSAVPVDRYWTNFLRPATSFGGIFRLDLLNDSLGHPGVKLLNFCTHVAPRHKGSSMLSWTEADIERRYLRDFESRFGTVIEPEWTHTSRIGLYSPVFVNGYRNPPVRHSRLGNLFLAGNHRTFPVLATTGSAMGSGVEAAHAVLNSDGAHLRAIEAA